ncbi:kinase-like domain-containing protein [Lasiosphaeria hispida]|uniref:Kinase-like domain-containing protein n=1 Tax=Lasiosphaeria hispida TaxID=260671 RepID=A0AAJ0HE41_9PEZI|nr:kinase-like domain-containing protein [Lasiosphaeria hispida]
MSELTIASKNDVERYGFDEGSRYFRWVLGSVHEDDTVYMTGMLAGSPEGHSVEQIQSALVRVPGEELFTPLPIPFWFARTTVTVHDSWDTEPDPDIYYLKRPWLVDYRPEEDASLNTPGRLAYWFAFEIKRLEQLARHPPHPNLVRYHGCRVRKGCVTAVLLHRVPGDTLRNHIQAGKTIPDKEAFLQALTSAVHHLHNVIGLAHNDIHLNNIMVSPDGTTPTLIDVGSAYPEGEEMIRSPMFSCWGKDPLDMDPETYFVGPLIGYAVSRKSRDLAALERLHTWLDNPDLGPEHCRQLDPDFVEVGNRRMKEVEARREAAREEEEEEEEEEKERAGRMEST